jgi:integrase
LTSISTRPLCTSSDRLRRSRLASPSRLSHAPNQLSWLWRSACKARKARPVSLHALRHAHASALIPTGLDVVAIGRCLGHANPTVTLNIYGHLFKKDDSAAAMAIDAVMG